MEITATEVGMISGLLIILAAGAKGIWVWGWHYQEVKRERDRLLKLALDGTSLAEKTVEIIEDSSGSTGNRNA